MMRGAGLGAAIVAAMFGMIRGAPRDVIRYTGRVDPSWSARIDRRISIRRAALAGRPWRAPGGRP